MIIKHLENTPSYSNSLFSNYVSLFKPGLITKAIFQQKSLILKNIAEPLPSVLERFNELLSVMPTLTLFEDTSNTFTTKDNKTLSVCKVQKHLYPRWAGGRCGSARSSARVRLCPETDRRQWKDREMEWMGCLGLYWK